jgi:hypothetical protein
MAGQPCLAGAERQRRRKAAALTPPNDQQFQRVAMYIVISKP